MGTDTIPRCVHYTLRWNNTQHYTDPAYKPAFYFYTFYLSDNSTIME
jgi:hypothetical protein